jgi:hypothetical protein
LPAAYSTPDPDEALNGLIRAFIRFSASERLAIRRLRALAVLQPVVEESLRQRDERQGLGAIVDRMMEKSGKPSLERREEVVDLLHVLSGFQTYDALAPQGRSNGDVED